MQDFSLVRLMTLTLAIATIGCLGCSGNDGSTRYKVSGKVTLNGKPAPAFEIFFRPDPSQGNSGPGATALGRDGLYETRKGVTTGPHLAEIMVFDGIPNGESNRGSAMILKPYKTTLTIPAEDLEHDFDVPDSHLAK